MQAEAAEALHNKRPMASLRRLLVLVLLGTARAPPPGNDGGGSDSCAEDGSSATYTETISTDQGVTKRTIVSAGCPNHESYCTGKDGVPGCGAIGEQGTGTEAGDQGLTVTIPAEPILKDSYTAEDTKCEMGTIAYALNGVALFSGAVDT